MFPPILCSIEQLKVHSWVGMVHFLQFFFWVSWHWTNNYSRFSRKRIDGSRIQTQELVKLQTTAVVSMACCSEIQSAHHLTQRPAEESNLGPLHRELLLRLGLHSSFFPCVEKVWNGKTWRRWEWMDLGWRVIGDGEPSWRKINPSRRFIKIGRKNEWGTLPKRECVRVPCACGVE